MIVPQIDRQDYQRELRHALLNVALKLGAGYGRDGKSLGWIFDCREMLMSGPHLHYAARLLWERLRPYRPELVGGRTMGADLLTVALLYEAWRDDHPLQAFTVRKEPKSDGLRKLVEGAPIRPGARVVLVDDVVNSGETLRAALEAVERLGADVVAAGAIVDFGRRGEAWVREKGLALEALFTLADLGMVNGAPTGGAAASLRWTWGPLNRDDYSAPKSAPCIAHDTVFVGSDSGIFVALDLDGRERWRYPVRDQQRGVHSSPLVHDGRVYFGAYDGYLYCLDASTGGLIWEARHGQWVGSSPTIDPRRGLVFVGIEYGAAGGILAAIEAASGRLVWKLETSNYVHSSPWFDADRDLVIVGSNDGRLYAADAATGVERWHFETGGEIKGRPMVDGDGRCFAGSFDGYLYALDAASGRLEWKRRLGYRVFADPLVHGDLVIAGGHSWRVVGIERATGSVRWVATTGGRILGGAARVTDSSVAIGSADGYVYLVDARTGAVTWRYKTDGPIRSRPAVADGLLVIPSCGGPLYAFSV